MYSILMPSLRALLVAISSAAVFTPASAQDPAAGQAKGQFTVNGKAYPLTHAAAFIDTSDARKPTVLVLSDQPLPAQARVSSASLSMQRNISPFSGLALWMDAQRTIFRAEYYEKGDPTATSGLFELKFNAPTGPALAGAVVGTPAAAGLKKPVGAQVRFNAAPN